MRSTFRKAHNGDSCSCSSTHSWSDTVTKFVAFFGLPDAASLHILLINNAKCLKNVSFYFYKQCLKVLHLLASKQLVNIDSHSWNSFKSQHISSKSLRQYCTFVSQRLLNFNEQQFQEHYIRSLPTCTVCTYSPYYTQSTASWIWNSRERHQRTILYSLASAQR